MTHTLRVSPRRPYLKIVTTARPGSQTVHFIAGCTRRNVAVKGPWWLDEGILNIAGYTGTVRTDIKVRTFHHLYIMILHFPFTVVQPKKNPNITGT